MSPIRSVKKVSLKDDGRQEIGMDPRNTPLPSRNANQAVSPSFSAHSSHTRRSSLSGELRGSALHVDALNLVAIHDHRVSSADVSITQFACADEIGGGIDNDAHDGDDYQNYGDNRFGHAGGITIASKANLPFSDEDASNGEDGDDNFNCRSKKDPVDTTNIGEHQIVPKNHLIQIQSGKSLENLQLDKRESRARSACSLPKEHLDDEDQSTRNSIKHITSHLKSTSFPNCLVEILDSSQDRIPSTRNNESLPAINLQI
jgi:hypothetical protein